MKSKFLSRVSRYLFIIILIYLIFCGVLLFLYPGNEQNPKAFPDTIIKPKIKTIQEFWDEPTLLNLKNFTWSMRNQNVCRTGMPNVQLMPILVHTARSHFQERLAIRRSYGSVSHYNNWAIRLIFLLGEADRKNKSANSLAESDDEDKALNEEQFNFGDLVIGSFVDTYRNITYKHLMGYKWILNFCPEAALVLKVDDDFFIDTIEWLNWRIDDLQNLRVNQTAMTPDVYCGLLVRSPIRDKKVKWYVTEEEWEDSQYPKFCHGAAYASTVDVIRKVYITSSNVKFFWLDDVFVTGILFRYIESKFNFSISTKNVTNKFTLENNYLRWLKYCDIDLWHTPQNFGAAIQVMRGPLLDIDMMCLFIMSMRMKDSPYFRIKG